MRAVARARQRLDALLEGFYFSLLEGAAVLVSRLKHASERLAGRFDGWQPAEPQQDLEALDAIGGIQ